MAAPGFVTPPPKGKRPLEPVQASMLPEGMGSISPTEYSPAAPVSLSPVVANAKVHAAEPPRGALVTPNPKGLGLELGEVGRRPGEPPALNVQAANPGTPFLERVNRADAEDAAASAAAEAAAAAPKKTGGRHGKKSHKKHGKKSHKKHRKTRRRVRFDRI